MLGPALADDYWRGGDVAHDGLCVIGVVKSHEEEMLGWSVIRDEQSGVESAILTSYQAALITPFSLI